MTSGSRSDAPPRTSLDHVERVVVKVGSAVIAAGGSVSNEVLRRLADDVLELRSLGCEVVMVVSGAVAAGYRPLGLESPPDEVVLRQAAASIGQPQLMAALGDAFGRHGVSVAQLLLSALDIENRRRFLSARHTMQNLLDAGVVPIINENDALSDDELAVGDNDHLATLVTTLTGAELMIVLSQIDGVRRDGGAGERISVVHHTAELEPHLSDSRSATGVGGMRAKVAAARLARDAGVSTVIADGREAGVLQRIYRGEDVGTLVMAPTSKLPGHKRWIAIRTRSHGVLQIDGETCSALAGGAAGVAPSGILAVEGSFQIGARVEIKDEASTGLAFGLVSYAANEIRLMRGRDAGEFESVLGYRYVDDIVQQEDIVMFHEIDRSEWTP